MTRRGKIPPPQVKSPDLRKGPLKSTGPRGLAGLCSLLRNANGLPTEDSPGESAFCLTIWLSCAEYKELWFLSRKQVLALTKAWLSEQRGASRGKAQ